MQGHLHNVHKCNTKKPLRRLPKPVRRNPCTQPRQLLDWNLLRSFEAVAGKGLGRAASTWGSLTLRSPGTSSSWREQLGQTLFDRTSTGLALSDLRRRLASLSQAMGGEAAQFLAGGSSAKYA